MPAGKLRCLRTLSGACGLELYIGVLFARRSADVAFVFCVVFWLRVSVYDVAFMKLDVVSVMSHLVMFIRHEICTKKYLK